MTYKILQVKVKRPDDHHPNARVVVEIDWEKDEGYRLTVRDVDRQFPFMKAAETLDVRYYAKLSSVLMAAGRVVKRERME